MPAFCRPLPAALNITLIVQTLALPSLATSAPPAVPWDSNKQDGFVTSLTGDRQGHIWASTEDDGVWEYSSSSPVGKQWTQFTAANTNGGLGDDDIYSLTCDRLGRIWAGTGRDGVSVFNGKAWKTYDRLTGPLGCHVVALATSPVTGDVWGCTESGLFQYALKTNVWRYFTRADGLPSDQATCLAFTRTGTLLVGTNCDGIAIASPTNGYKTWRVVGGPDAMPASLRGSGLPTSLMNCLFVSRTGTIYAGTTTGLARSENGGRTWRFVRGADWEDKLAGLYHPMPPQGEGTGGLLEDYVTSLAEDGAGRLYVGHRKLGLEVLDALTGTRLDDPKTAYGGFVDALLPTRRGHVLIGTYGDGLRTTIWPVPISSTKQANVTVTPSFPAPAAPPVAAQLKSMLKQVQMLSAPLLVGEAAYLGEDWTTHGDWVGRYGRRYAILWAMSAPWNEEFVNAPTGLYQARAQIGPNHDAGDAIRHYVTWKQTDDPRSLYDLEVGCRRQSEADDHGETYPMTKTGPDLWFTVQVPQGVHRVSLYFFNKDGDVGENRYRDYLVELKPYMAKGEEDAQQRAGLSPPQATGELEDLAAAAALPDLARARVRNFRGGVYPQFVVRGPAQFLIRVGKNNSLNTICSGLFVDNLTGPAYPEDARPMLAMGDVQCQAPPPMLYLAGSPVTSPGLGSETLQAARGLWAALDAGAGQRGALSLQGPYRIFAYRAVTADSMAWIRQFPQPRPDKRVDSSLLLENWRWNLRLWDDQARINFGMAMAEAFQQHQRINHRGSQTASAVNN